MKRYTFTIEGNQEQPDGNPIPYERGAWHGGRTARYTRYEAWKQWVVMALIGTKTRVVLRRGKPIRGTPKGRLTLLIGFKGENHADPDNVAKGILDALVENDKHVDVTTHHYCRATQPKVDVVLDIEE